MNPESISLFVTCASALEPLLEKELSELGIESPKAGFRGVYVNKWDWSTIYKINYCSRLASRVLLPLIEFKCFDGNSIYKNAMHIDWSRFIRGRSTFAIDANVHHRELRNSLYAAQVLKDAICDQMRQKTGHRPSVNVQEPDVQLNLFVHNNRGVISFDTSGAPLHKRGYRIESGEAPLKETLAAAILKLADYNKEAIFFDPCCGSGTFLIEAALLAANIPPGYLRHRWGFMHHPHYNQIDWLRVKNESDAYRQPIGKGKIFGIDIGKEVVRGCKSNLRAAGFLQEIEVQQADFRDYVPSITPTMMIANPPYGKRLEEEDRLVSLYRALGDFFKKYSSKPGKGYVFTGNLELAKEVGLASTKKHILYNGPIESRLLEFELY